MILQVIFLISRDIGASIMVGLITAIGIAIYSYFQNTSVRKAEENVKLKEIEKNLEHNKLKSLLNLYEKGILTKLEYEQKSKKVKENIENQEIKKTRDYWELKGLMESGVLTQQEFNEKLITLKQKYSEIDKCFKPPKHLSNLGIEDFIEIKNAYLNGNETTLRAVRRRLEKILKVKSATTDIEFIQTVITEYEN